ncbi:hypothetical protein ABFS83_10G131100 [Erythranthe nasuta]
MAKLSQKKNTTTVIATVSANPVTNPGIKAKRTRKTIPRDSPPQRSSVHRGVTRHRWTGRYEAHLWDKNCWNEAQNKKGRQVYLGAYDDEVAAAHAYDLAALKYWGPDTILNFPLSTYQKELMDMEIQSREEYIGSLRRKSSGFSRGVSKYRGVARHHHNGRWEARIGRVFGNKYLYLGTYATQEEAAVAYDMAAIEYRGLHAVTNFDLSRYIKWLRPNNNTTTDTNSQHDPSGGSASLHHLQQPSDTTIAALPQPRTATSALGLLLQSSKFKEMTEMNLAAEYYCPSMHEQEYSDHVVTQSSNNISDDDIKTYFESNDFCEYNNEEGDEDIFGELDSFMHRSTYGSV